MIQQGGKTDPFGERGFQFTMQNAKGEKRKKRRTRSCDMELGGKKGNAYFLILDKPYG